MEGRGICFSLKYTVLFTVERPFQTGSLDWSSVENALILGIKVGQSAPSRRVEQRTLLLLLSGCYSKLTCNEHPPSQIFAVVRSSDDDG